MVRLLMTLLFSATLFTFAQGPGGGPPPLQPPPEPAGNPVTLAKTNLGLALFWDEQLSSTRTMACGTCHIPSAGGTDDRVAGNNALLNPGPDGEFDTPDDIIGSPGVPVNFEDGTYGWSNVYGLMEQVTGRRAPSAVDAAYSDVLFWDGRAEDTLFDPVTGDVVLANGAALESQVLGPPLSGAEMGHVDRDWPDVAARIAESTPLVLSPDIPASLETWLDGRDYPALFEEAFGTADVTPARIAMAIATYERTLFSDETPFDVELGGGNALTQQERQGRQIFVQNDCSDCHSGNLLTDDDFHYIGVRPVNEDLGRFDVTGNNRDRGRFKTPGLRNVALRDRFMHNGQFTTLQEVVAFYNRGGDFNSPNKDNRIRPLGLNGNQQAALVAFLSRPLTDPRVAAETGPFERPALYANSNRVPSVSGFGVAGSGGEVPLAIALEPPLLGNPSFTVGVQSALANASATWVLDTVDPGIDGLPTSGSIAFETVQTQGAGTGEGYASVSTAFPGDASLAGQSLFGRWYIADPNAPDGVAVSELVTIVPFGDGTGTGGGGGGGTGGGGGGGGGGTDPGPGCGRDFDGDGRGNVRDLIHISNNFGPCNNCPEDTNGDGMVDANDIHHQAGGWNCNED